MKSNWKLDNRVFMNCGGKSGGPVVSLRVVAGLQIVWFADGAANVHQNQCTAAHQDEQ